jgi:hypothetical protein
MRQSYRLLRHGVGLPVEVVRNLHSVDAHHPGFSHISGQFHVFTKLEERSLRNSQTPVDDLGLASQRAPLQQADDGHSASEYYQQQVRNIRSRR